MAKKHKDNPSGKAAHANGAAHTNQMATTTLKGLRKRAGQTQEELAAALGVGQDTISRLEKRSDMLLSTLHHYVQSIGGELALVANFPGEPSLIIDYRDKYPQEQKKRGPKPAGLESP